MQASAETERALLDAGFVEQAQYAVSMAYRIRFVMQMTAREAMHLTELRSQPAGHPVYRRVAQSMHRLIADVHPAIGETFSYVSYDEVDLERLEAERRTEEKRKAMREGPGRGVTSPGSVTALVRGDTIDVGDRWGRERPTGSLGTDSIFYVGSIAKQFVAACVAFLERDGAFDLERPRLAVRAAASRVGRPRHDPAPDPPHGRREGAAAHRPRRSDRRRAGLG